MKIMLIVIVAMLTIMSCQLDGYEACLKIGEAIDSVGSNLASLSERHCNADPRAVVLAIDFQDWCCFNEI